MEILNPASISLGLVLNYRKPNPNMVEPVYSSLENLTALPNQINESQPECTVIGNSVSLENLQNSSYLCDYVHEDYANFNMLPNIPINVMPPPPHNLYPPNANMIMRSCSKKDFWKNRGDARANSPHGSESDESCRSYKSRNSPLNNQISKGKSSKNGYQTYFNQNLLYGKYSNSSPNVFYTSGGTQNHLNGSTKHKVRYNGNGVVSNNNNNRARRDNKRFHPQDINKRIYGLMERFSSRAKVLNAVITPLHLLCGGSWDQLNQSIWDVYTTKVQKEQTYIHKLELWRMVYIHISKILIRFGLFMVGSTMSGLGTDNSDVDMCLLVKPCLNDPRSDALSYLQNIQAIIMNCDFVKNPEVIMAKVPILKFRDSQYGFEVDLNCNNAVGIRNTHLLHCYARLDWRVRPLIIIVKLWAQANNINDAKNMTISSYSLALMVINYLQCGVTPPAIPCLHGIYPEKFNPNSEIHSIDIQEELPPFNSDNRQSLGELFLGFLEYYASFRYDRYAISVREGTLLLKEECRYAKSLKNDVTQWKLLCIEEPFDLTNTARSVYDVDTFEHIKNVFQYSYKALYETKLLSTILPMTECVQR